MTNRKLIPAITLVTLLSLSGLQNALPQERPTVALVLAAGGALGFSHVGAIEVIEELGIPVDIVVGSSMGAVIGGLYSVGYDAEAMRQIAAEAEWETIFLDPRQGPLRPIEEKQADVKYAFQLFLDTDGVRLPEGLSEAEQVTTLLDALTLPYSTVRDFDELPRRYRAVSVDLVSEQLVALGEGSLATAMRASMAIPGVFSPVRLGEMVLVDGGVLSRLPVEVARDLGADVVIAVDLMQPQAPAADLETPTGVVGESLRLALDYYAEPARQDADILIVPDLTGFTGNDYSRFDELIARGVAAAEDRRSELEALALELRPRSNSRHSLKREIVVRDVVVRGVDERLQREVIRRLGIRPGERLDLLELNRRVRALFPVGEIDGVRYTIRDPEGGLPAEEGTLVLDVTRDFPRPHLLRFGYRISSRFTRGEQDTALLLANVTLRDLTGAGSSWSTDLYVINAERLVSRYQQPLGRFFFLAPQIEAGDEERPVYVDGTREAIFSDREVAVELQAGFELRAIARLYGGYRIGYVDSEITTGTAPSLESFQGRVGALVAGAETDTRDRFPFPTRGSREVIRYSVYNPGFGSELRAAALESLVSQVVPIAPAHSVTVVGRFDTSFEDSPPAFLLPRLGGQESFVGYEEDAFIAPNVAAASLGYQFRFAEGTGNLQEEFFLRLRGNVGSVHAGPLSQWPDAIDLIYGASVGFGINSIVGAFQFDVAWGGEDRWIAYFSLGNAL